MAKDFTEAYKDELRKAYRENSNRHGTAGKDAEFWIDFIANERQCDRDIIELVAERDAAQVHVAELEAQVKALRQRAKMAESDRDSLCNMLGCGLNQTEKALEVVNVLFYLKERSRWISVSERLPERSARDILVIVNGAVSKDYCFEEGKWWRYYWEDWNECESSLLPSHWMYYLDPPHA